jgi:AAA domain-containing protein/winged helix-turn-helix DNA-binding protein
MRGEELTPEKIAARKRELRAEEHKQTTNGEAIARLKVNSEAFAKVGAQYREQGPTARRDQRKPPSRVTGAGTFMRSYEPISYTLNGIVPSSYLYGLTAKQGSGKTAFMISAALAVGFDREDILACAVERGRVAYVTIENPVDFKMKLAVNCYVHNISYDEVEPRIAIIDGRDTPEQIFEGLRLDAEANGGFQPVCFDTFQAGFAAAGAGAFNDNEAVLGYLIRLRPLTTLPGLPSLVTAFHPTKNAGEGELIPYGGGATLNEIDGNLTLWKEGTIKLHHNRLRGPEFEPRFFRIERLSCPDIMDKSGRQILLPVLRPTTEMDAEERAIVSRNTKLELLRAMLAEPKGTQRDWATKTNLSPSTVNEKLKTLEGEKLVKKILDAWVLTPNGKNLAQS